MHRSTKASTAVIALSWAFLSSQIAYAETSAANANSELTDDVQDSAAQQDGDEVSRGDVIIVTARRRQETAQEVPLAISVIRGDSIESTGNFNVVKLQQLAPTLQVYTSNPRNTSVNIRGLGVPFGLTSDGFEQGVGIYVDDVYNARVAAATFDFLDVEQVEVLRGPQIVTSMSKTISAFAARFCSSRTMISASRYLVITASRILNAAAPCSSVSDARSARWHGNMKHWLRHKDIASSAAIRLIV